MIEYRTKEELEAGLPGILESPQDNGTLECIVIRPAPGERESLKISEISLAGGVHGDHWANGCWMTTEGGKPHPDVQICIMNARCIALIAGDKDHWPPAGDNLFVDLDLRPESLPSGIRLCIGSAMIEITDTPHNACASFVERYGKAAAVFVNGAKGKAMRLRGIYGRVVQDGQISVGDRIRKVS